MSFEWPKLPLSDVAEVFTGFAFKSDKYLPPMQGVRVVRGDNVTERFVRWGEKEKCWHAVTEDLKPYLLRVGDVVIGMDGSKVGRNFAAISKKDDGSLLAQRVARVRAKEGSNQDFIRYLICNPDFTNYVQSVHTGTSIPHISKGQIERFEVSVPPLNSQKLIAEILVAFDDRITLLHETNETLEAIAQALFKSWFVDFDPVRAKQSGKKPEGMDETTASFFPDSFKQSELGEIPTGWEIKKLKEILDLFGGQAFKSKDYISEGIFVLRTNNFKQGIVLKNDNDVFLPNSFLDSYKDFVCEEFDYHLVMVGASIGNTGMIFPHLLPALRNQNMWCFRPKNKQVLSRLYTKFIVDKISKELINFASGSAREFFKRDDFKNHKLIIPHDKVLKSYAEITDPILERISINYNNIDILNNLRNTLLPRLISGKLKMTDMKKEINNKTNVTA